MSYLGKDTSVTDSAPIALYQFVNGNSSWKYTTAVTPVTRNTLTFAPEQIHHSELEETTELNKQYITLSVPRTNDVAKMFGAYPPTQPTYLTIWETHDGDAEAVVVWMGRVMVPDFQGATAEFRCEPISTALRRLNLRRYYQRQCPHILYGPDCRLDENAFKSAVTVSSVAGLDITVFEALVAGKFAGGMLSWDTPIGLQWRFVTDNTTSSVSVNLPFMALGDAYHRDLPRYTVLHLYEGCQHTMTDCLAKGNGDNFGGFLFSSLVGSFGGKTLY